MHPFWRLVLLVAAVLGLIAIILAVRGDYEMLSAMWHVLVDTGAGAVGTALLVLLFLMSL